MRVNLSKLKGQGEDIIESGTSQMNRRSSFMPETAAQNKNPRLKSNENCSKGNIRKENSPQILDLVSISKDVDLSQYWNVACRENQSSWWLPHQTETLDQDTLSSRKSLNWEEEVSNFWKKSIVPTNLIRKPSFLSLHPSVIHTTAKEAVKGTRKIRVYPKDEANLGELLRQQRRAYNLAIACFKEQSEREELRGNSDYSKTELRRTIREFVRSEVEERGGE